MQSQSGSALSTVTASLRAKRSCAYRDGVPGGNHRKVTVCSLAWELTIFFFPNTGPQVCSAGQLASTSFFQGWFSPESSGPAEDLINIRLPQLAAAQCFNGVWAL